MDSAETFKYRDVVFYISKDKRNIWKDFELQEKDNEGKVTKSTKIYYESFCCTNTQKKDSAMLLDVETCNRLITHSRDNDIGGVRIDTIYVKKYINNRETKIEEISKGNALTGKGYNNPFREALNFILMNVEDEYRKRVMTVSVMRPEELGLFLRKINGKNPDVSNYNDKKCDNFESDYGTIVRVTKLVQQVLRNTPSIFLQEKIDGVRIIATVYIDHVEFKTRQGVTIPNEFEITKKLETELLLFFEYISEMYPRLKSFEIDGELFEQYSFTTTNRIVELMYNHNENNNNIIKVNNLYISGNYKYYIFDIMIDQFYKERYQMLEIIAKDNKKTFQLVSVLSSYEISYSNIDELLKRLMLLMYIGSDLTEIEKDSLGEMWNVVPRGGRKPEGLILKFPDRMYDRCNHSRHSRYILKLKYCITSSFMIKSITIVNVGIVVNLIMDSGKVFSAGINLPHEEQEKILQNQNYWIGRYVEVQFIDYTDKGTPKYAKTQMIERVDEVI